MTEIRPLIVGNWKMNGLQSAVDEYKKMTMTAASENLRDAIDLVICPPATLIAPFATAHASERSIALGAQSCHAAASGAHTGDLSAEMLADAGAGWVIAGHSERRADHGECDADVSAQVAAAARAGLSPIICVGETLEDRDRGQALDVVLGQLAGSAPAAIVDDLAVAYEPVWAIGTGRTPSSDDIAEVHHAIQAALIARYGPEGAAMRVLYGGSVKPNNAAEILRLEPVGGALIGGASLTAESFIAIAQAAREAF